jgi:hypothetical protein
MNHIRQILFLSILLLLSSCITQFIPQTTEDRDILVVEGLITDKPEANIIKLSRPNHLGLTTAPIPISDCIVTVSDDSGQSFTFSEKKPGTYASDPAKFQGVIGRLYTLHITAKLGTSQNYESFPMELKPVPPIDSVYYEKVVFSESTGASGGQEGCQILLDTHDPLNKCKFYRWEYSETWEFHLPYTVPNSVCWVSNNSDVINIKNTSVIGEDRISRYPLNLVTNQTDRLRVKYSLLVNQYSLTEDEYNYWEKLQNISEQVGGLYDIIPSAIPSNIYCVDDPNQKVLGYFSVSAKSSVRIFIKDRFAGVHTDYTDRTCIADTVIGNNPIQYLNSSVWVIINNPLPPPGYRVTTRVKACYDCTVRGTKVMPDFWQSDK